MKTYRILILYADGKREWTDGWDHVPVIGTVVRVPDTDRYGEVTDFDYGFSSNPKDVPIGGHY